jgi:ferric-dicitrate binding protein FerR (iron transport regulator)
MSSAETPWVLLDRYLSGECSAEEALAVERWVEAEPTRRRLLEGMRQVPEGRWDVDGAWEVVRSRARAAGERGRDGVASEPVIVPSASSNQPAHQRLSRRSILLRAAVIAGVAAGSLLIGQSILDRSDDESRGGSLVAVAARTERDTVTLADGSTVILAAESRLEYPGEFAATSRDVTLVGEAFFRVSQDAAKPFVVRAGTALVQVVGTEFVVRTPADSANDVTIAVAEGSVSVRPRGAPSGQGVLLHPNQVARVNPEGVTTVSDAGDLDRYLGWVEGRLVFDNAPLPVVLAELERWYALEFRVVDANLSSRRVTARLRVGSLQETMDALALALGVRHHQVGDTIILDVR